MSRRAGRGVPSDDQPQAAAQEKDERAKQGRDAGIESGERKAAAGAGRVAGRATVASRGSAAAIAATAGAATRARGTTPEAKLLAIFDVFDEWFRTEDFEGCSFINVLLEMSAEADLQRASALHLKNIRSIVALLAEDAGLRDSGSFAHSWHILMKGSIVAAAEGDVEAAQRAKSMAQLLIDQHRG